MKKIDIRKSLDDKVRSAEWTDSDTWKVLDRIRKTASVSASRRFTAFLPAAAALVLVLCIGAALLLRAGTPDQIRDPLRPIETALSPSSGPYEESIRLYLREEYPEVADKLVPLELSTEKDGIRVTLHSALVNGKAAYILFSAQDLEGDRVTPDMRFSLGLTDDAGDCWRISGSWSPAYVPEEHKAAFFAECKADGPVRPGEHTVSLNLENLRFYEGEEADLLPLLKQYAPADGKGIAEVNVPLYRTASLAGIGWADGLLHVQIDAGDYKSVNLFSAQFGCRVAGTDQDGSGLGESRYKTLEWGGLAESGHPLQVDYISEVSPEERDSLTELTVVFREVSDVAEGIWEIAFPVTPVPGGETPETASEDALSCEEAVRLKLEERWPGIMDQLKPVNLSCEDQGVRMEILSGLIRGNESWIVWSLEDLEGGQLDETNFNIMHEWDTVGPIESESDASLYWNSEEHKAVYLWHRTYTSLNEPVDGCYTYYMDQLYHHEAETFDLKPLLKEYAESVEGIRPPDHAMAFNGYYGERAPDGLKFLDYTCPLDIPLTERGKLLLTGIGWIDGKLHVQIHEAEPSFCKIDENRFSRYDSVNVVNYSYNGYDFDKVYRNSPFTWEDPDNPWDRWLEFILDSSPDDVRLMSLKAEMGFTTATATGNWEIRVPVSMIREEAGTAD